MPPSTILLIVAAATLLFGLLILSVSLRIVPEYKRLVVFRLGRLIGMRGPGLVLLLPFIDFAASVDLREQSAQIKLDATVTQDKTIVDIDVALSYKVIDPIAVVLKLADMPAAVQATAARILRDAIGRQAYADLLYARDRIGADVLNRLRGEVRDWGIDITGVELREPHKRQSV